MVVNKRKKSSRQRGSWTHGWGAKKKHRGAGHRGGRGHAGSGKRGDAKSPSYTRIKGYFGKHGFHSKASRVAAVNIGYLNAHADALVKKGMMTKSGDTYTIDISKLSFGKLLGSGSVSKRLIITVAAASKSAVDKVSAKGGSVTMSKSDSIKNSKKDSIKDSSKEHQGRV